MRHEPRVLKLRVLSQARCPACNWVSFASRDRDAVERAAQAHKDEHRPYCIARVLQEDVQGPGAVLAALKFKDNPCNCVDCFIFDRYIEELGGR